MLYYRLYADLPGRSPLAFGRAAGRWNAQGVPMIYASLFTSMNFLELLCIRGSIVTSVDWKMALIDIAEEAPKLHLDALPIDWNALPHRSSTQALGQVWMREAASPFLKVPSARLPLASYPKEHNLLINPLFEDFQSRLTIKDIWDVGFLLNAK